jgi:hypothetical protein
VLQLRGMVCILDTILLWVGERCSRRHVLGDKFVAARFRGQLGVPRWISMIMEPTMKQATEERS